MQIAFGHTSHIVEKRQLVFGAVVFATTAMLWNFHKRYFIFWIVYTSIFVLSALVPWLCGKQISNDDLAFAYVGGSAIANLCSALQWGSLLSLKKRLLRRFFIFFLGLILSLSSALSVLILGYYFINGKALSATIVLTLFQTNMSEALSYLKDQNIFVWSMAFLLVIAIFAALLILFRQRKSQIWKCSQKINLFILLLICVISTNTVYRVIHKANFLPLRILSETQNALHEYTQYQENKAVRWQKLQQLSNLCTTNKNGVWVLVIGESESRDHMQLYGYNRPDTPWLASQKSNPDNLIFTHAYSNHTHTVPALTYALSQKNQYNDIDLKDAYSIIEVAKAAGYETYWISNQRKYGAWDTPVAEMATVTDHQIWLNTHAGTHDTDTDYYDEKLAECLPDLAQNKNVLIVVHLMGCHGSYSDRYPQEYNQFHGDNKTVDNYDDAVAYNDYVLQRIYERVSQYDSFHGMIYFSDHGDDADNNLGHDASKFTDTMSHIPFLIFLSNQYVKDYPQTFNTLKRHQEDYWTNDLAFDLLVDLLGIQGISHDAGLDIAAPQYHMTKETVRTLHGNRCVDGN